MKVRSWQGILTQYDPSFYDIFLGHFFANMGRWGLSVVFTCARLSKLFSLVCTKLRTVTSSPEHRISRPLLPCRPIPPQIRGLHPLRLLVLQCFSYFLDMGGGIFIPPLCGGGSSKLCQSLTVETSLAICGALHMSMCSPGTTTCSFDRNVGTFIIDTQDWSPLHLGIAVSAADRVGAFYIKSRHRHLLKFLGHNIVFCRF